MCEELSTRLLAIGPEHAATVLRPLVTVHDALERKGWSGVASLPAPVLVKNFKQSVAERFDVIMDFSQYKAGTEIILINRAEQVNGRGPTNNLLTPGFEVLKFIVTSDAFGVDNSRIPAKLRPLPDMKQPISNSRVWKFERSGGEWVVNGQPYNRDVVSAKIPEGSAERWSIINGGAAPLLAAE